MRQRAIQSVSVIKNYVKLLRQGLIRQRNYVQDVGRLDKEWLT